MLLLLSRSAVVIEAQSILMESVFTVFAIFHYIL